MLLYEAFPAIAHSIAHAGRYAPHPRIHRRGHRSPRTSHDCASRYLHLARLSSGWWTRRWKDSRTTSQYRIPGYRTAAIEALSHRENASLAHQDPTQLPWLSQAFSSPRCGTDTAY